MDSVFITTRKQRIIRELRDYMLIALGMLMYAIGWTVFLLPNDLPSGAVPGIASIVYWATGLPVQYTYLGINGALLILSLVILGWKFACFEYSHLDKCIAIMGADMLSSIHLGSLWILILFILFTALVNLIMVSATAKWTFMSFIFVPFFANMGISPDMVQCAFRIGDSATNAITPFMFYMPLILTYMQQYDKQATYGSLLKYTWRYSLYILLAWTLLFILWYVTGLPLGL